jgi:phytanoyl-CoA hydroxylase
MTLTQKQLAQYQHDGFLIREDFVTESDCLNLQTRAEQLVNSFEPVGERSIFSTHEQSRLADEYFLGSGDKVHFFFEENAFLPDGSLRQTKEKSINKIGHALHDLDPIFSAFSRLPQIEQLVADLGIQRPLLLQSMYIFKQPNIGGEVTCHQDSTFLYTEPISIAGLWFAIEDATIENGCLWAIPGGHLYDHTREEKQTHCARSPGVPLALRSRWRRGPDGLMGFEVFDSQPWPEERLAPLEVRRGTLIVLHGLLPHKSLANRSAKSRHAYTLHAIGGDCDYPADNWLQRPASMPLRGFH